MDSLQLDSLKNTIVCSLSRYEDICRHAENIEVIACMHVSDAFVFYVNDRGQVIKVFFEPDEIEQERSARFRQ